MVYKTFAFIVFSLCLLPLACSRERAPGADDNAAEKEELSADDKQAEKKEPSSPAPAPDRPAPDAGKALPDGATAAAKPEAVAAEPEAVAALLGISAETRLDRLPPKKVRKLCAHDLATRQKRANGNQAAGLGCKFGAATFARSREGCRGFFKECMARNKDGPVVPDPCPDVKWSECRITVGEYFACREAEQRSVLELLEKLDCEYQGPRLQTAPATPECDVAKQGCPALFDYKQAQRQGSAKKDD